MTAWSAGHYPAVAERIAHIAEHVVDTAGRRRPLTGATVLDLACGTGSAALAAAARGAAVTGMDLTAELIALARQRDPGGSVDWRVGDASDTGLPDASFDAVVSNMGIVFVEPATQVAEIARLLRPGGVLAFSTWVRGAENPLHDPVVAVLGPPEAAHSPDQWAEPDTVHTRLGGHFDDITIDTGSHTWLFESHAAAMRFVTEESPMHVGLFARAADARDALRGAFADALGRHVDGRGAVAFEVPYAVVSAVRS